MSSLQSTSNVRAAIGRRPPKISLASLPSASIRRTIAVVILFVTATALSGLPSRSNWYYVLGGIPAAAPLVTSEQRLIIASEDRYLYSLTTEGQLQWRYDLAHRPTRSLALTPSGAILVGVQNGAVHLINSNGIPLWLRHFRSAQPHSAVVASDETIHLVYDDGHYLALTPSGRLLWDIDLDVPVALAPVSDRMTTLHIATADNRLHTFDFDGIHRCSRYFNEPPTSLSIDGRGRLLAGGSRGTVEIIDHLGQSITRMAGEAAVAAIQHYGGEYLLLRYADGMLRLLDAAGAIIWSGSSGAIIDTALTAQGRLLVSNARGALMAAPPGQALHPIAFIPNSGGLFWPTEPTEGRIIAIGTDWVVYGLAVDAIGTVARLHQPAIVPAAEPSRLVVGECSVSIEAAEYRPDELRPSLVAAIHSNDRRQKQAALVEIEAIIGGRMMAGRYRQLLELLAYAAGELYYRPIRTNNRIVNDYPEVRATAVTLLGYIGEATAREHLVQIIEMEQNVVVLRESVAAVAAIGGDPQGTVVPALHRLLVRLRRRGLKSDIVPAITDALYAVTRHGSTANLGLMTGTLQWIITTYSDTDTQQKARQLLRWSDWSE